jgi:hypothetical protein
MSDADNAEKKRGVIGYGRHVETQYAPYLDHLAPALGKYQSVLVLSDYEVLHLHDLAKNQGYGNQQILDEVKRLYPDQARAIDALDPKSAAAFSSMITHITNKYSVTNEGPAALSLQFGTPGKPVNLGLMFLPERGIDLDMGERSSVMGGPGVQRASKTGFTVAHEVGHLVHDVGKGSPSVTFRNLDQVLKTGMGARTEKAILEAEIASDRFAQGATRDMIRAGLFKDDGIEKDVKGLRNLNSFTHLLQEGELVRDGKKTKVVNGVDTHATGFISGNTKDEAQEYQRLERAAVPIVQARDKKLMSIFNAAAEGKASPAQNVAFEIAVAAEKAPEKIVRRFRDEVMASPEFRREIATEIAATPGMPQDARGIAADYLEAFKHYQEKLDSPPAPTPVAPEAAPEPEPEARQLPFTLPQGSPTR